MQYWLRAATLLTISFTLFIVLIRALPDDDRAAFILSQENCSTSCLLGIQPGETTMRQAIYFLDAHAWVATRADNFPSQVQQAVFYDAAVPRISIQWQWSAALPDWINAAQPGRLTLENREVRDMTIDTYLSLGEIMLAFGTPDNSWFAASTTQIGQFEYSGWYAGEGMLVRGEGVCPVWHYHNFPVQLIFRPDLPNLPETVSRVAVCS